MEQLRFMQQGVVVELMQEEHLELVDLVLVEMVEPDQRQQQVELQILDLVEVVVVEADLLLER